jgi:hypothetical protein
MRKFCIALVGISLALGFGSTGFAQNSKSDTDSKTAARINSHIKIKYNHSRNETTVTLKTMALSNSMNKEFTHEGEFGQLDLDVYFSYQGQQLEKPADSLVLKFKGTSKNILWQRGQNLIAVIDDQNALLLGSTKYTSTSQTFYFEELLTISVPYEAMQKIASAKTLAFQLGTRNIRITADQFQDLCAMVSRMAP